jgi:hypothetical protein
VSSIQHPADDSQGEYLVDPGTVAVIVSQLLQIVLAMLGPEKAKAALEWETKAAIDTAASLAKAASDAEALDILRSRGIR